jgi:hypothetical protein
MKNNETRARTQCPERGAAARFKEHGVVMQGIRMGTRMYIFMALVAIAVLGSAASCTVENGGDEVVAPPVPWTILVYAGAGIDLSTNLVNDITAMNNAPLGTHMHVIVRAESGAGSRGSDACREVTWFQIQGGGLAPVVLRTELEADPDDAAWLSVGVEDIIAAYPADRYAVILWGYGSSWATGVARDGSGTLTPETADIATGMSAAQAAEAVTEGVVGAGLTETSPLEFIAVDGCLLPGNEVAYEFNDIAQTYMASADIACTEGWDYTEMLGFISSHSDLPATEIADHEILVGNDPHFMAGIVVFP